MSKDVVCEYVRDTIPYRVGQRHGLQLQEDLGQWITLDDSDGIRQDDIRAIARAILKQRQRPAIKWRRDKSVGQETYTAKHGYISACVWKWDDPQASHKWCLSINSGGNMIVGTPRATRAEAQAAAERVMFALEGDT